MLEPCEIATPLRSEYSTVSSAKRKREQYTEIRREKKLEMQDEAVFLDCPVLEAAALSPASDLDSGTNRGEGLRKRNCKVK